MGEVGPAADEHVHVSSIYEVPDDFPQPTGYHGAGNAQEDGGVLITDKFCQELGGPVDSTGTENPAFTHFLH